MILIALIYEKQRKLRHSNWWFLGNAGRGKRLDDFHCCITTSNNLIVIFPSKINDQSEEGKGGRGTSFCQAVRCEGNFQRELFSRCMEKSCTYKEIISETKPIIAFWRQHIKSEKMLYAFRSNKSPSEQKDLWATFLSVHCLFLLDDHTPDQTCYLLCRQMLKEENDIC